MLQNALFSLLNKGINALIPLLLIPLCNKIFGTVSYGELLYYQALVGLVITFSDYGFGITGLKATTLNANNHHSLSKLFSEISVIKIVFLLLGGICLAIYLMYFKQIAPKGTGWLLFIFVFGSLSLQSLIPFWMYQGLKKNKELAIINFLTKLLLLLLIVLIVLKSKYIYSVALVELLSYLFTLIVCLYLLKKQFQLKFQLPKSLEIKNQLILGYNYFIIELIYWVINGGSILFLEKYVTSFELGFYGIFLRFSYYIFAIFQPIILSILPFFIEKFKESISCGINYYKKIFTYFFISVVIVISTISFFIDSILKVAFSKEIVTYFQSHQFIPYTFFIWIFLFLLNNFTANTVLLSNHKEIIFRNSQFANGFTVIVLFILLVPKFGALGACISILSGQVAFLLCIFNYSYKFLIKKDQLKNY